MVQRAKVEVPGLVVGLGGGLALLVGLEQEELALGTYIKCIAHFCGTIHHPLQHRPGVTHKGGAVGIVHIADETGHLAPLGAPRIDAEGVQIGHQILIGLIDAGKALDRRAVNGDLAVQCAVQLGNGNGDILHLTQHIDELHPDEFDVLFLNNADNIFLGKGHGCPLPF